MNHKILNVLSLILLISVQINASFLTSRPTTLKLIEKLQNPKFVKTNGYDPILMSTIQLKLKSQGRLDDVIDLINQLDTDLTAEQASMDLDYNNKNILWASELSDLETQITTVSDEITAEQLQITELEAELLTLNDQLTDFQAQNDVFTQKRENLVDARANDIDAYNKRVSDQNAMLDALQNILDLLNSQDTAINFAEMKSLVQTNMKKFKETAGPYATLVGLTLSFDPQVVQNVIGKLNTIADAIKASLLDDKNSEEEAEVYYENFLASIDEALAAIQDNIKKTQQSIYDDNATLDETQQNMDINKALLDSLNAQKANYEKERDAYNALYEKDKQQRNYEINTVRAAEEVLQNHESSINEADNLSQ